LELKVKFYFYLLKKGIVCFFRDVLLLPHGVSYRRRVINDCRAQAGRNALQKTFSIPENSDDQVLRDEFAKTFCSKTFEERVSKEMDGNYKTSIDEFQNQIIKQCMANLFKQFPENNLQFLIQSGAKGKIIDQSVCLRICLRHLGEEKNEGRSGLTIDLVASK